MNPLIALLPCPLLMCAAAISFRSVGITTRIGCALMWTQLAISLSLFDPYLLDTSRVPTAQYGFRIDSIAAIFIVLTTLVVAASMTHAVGFFARESAEKRAPTPRHIAQIYFFTGLFLPAMYSVVAADNLGYLWIGMEATTLTSAPLVYFHRSRASLEAAWKYLIICSVGIAFAFFGTALLFSASQHIAGMTQGTLSLARLLLHAREMPHALVRLSYVFILLGYGTKAGLFPLHSWLPDAHSEAPAPVSAILSGGLLNCALVSLWRIGTVMSAAGEDHIVSQTLLPMGVGTVVASGFFLLRQTDLKRLLAYSSMENVGIMAVAISLSTPDGFVLQALNHSVVKVALFLTAGNLIQHFGTKKMRRMRGLLKSLPVQGALLFLLTAAAAGSPPFGSFLSEWRVLTVASDTRHLVAVIGLTGGIALSFVALSIQTARVLFGPARPAGETVRPSGLALVPGVLLAASLYLGLALSPHLVAIAGGLPRWIR